MAVSRHWIEKSVNPLACCVGIDVSKGLCCWLVHRFVVCRELYGGVLNFGVWVGAGWDGLKIDSDGRFSALD